MRITPLASPNKNNLIGWVLYFSSKMTLPSSELATATDTTLSQQLSPKWRFEDLRIAGIVVPKGGSKLRLASVTVKQGCLLMIFTHTNLPLSSRLQMPAAVVFCAWKNYKHHPHYISCEFGWALLPHTLSFLRLQSNIAICCWWWSCKSLKSAKMNSAKVSTLEAISSTRCLKCKWFQQLVFALHKEKQWNVDSTSSSQN